MTSADNGMPHTASAVRHLLNLDAAHVIHPYAAPIGHAEPLLVEGAEGAYLHLADGRKLLDGMASWWSVVHGYRHPKLVAALQTQAETLSHIMFGGLTHEPAIRLAARVATLTGLPRVFFCDSGSVAVEVALKMALQYWGNKGDHNATRSNIATLTHGYHGDTFATMALSDRNRGLHRGFRHMLYEPIFLPAPDIIHDADSQAASLAAIADMLAREGERIAALIVEPLVQGAGGMRFYSAAYLEALVVLAKRHDILVIFDEIATGFGRTGRMFAKDHITTSPDIMCLGKAITGGMMSFAATLCSEEVARRISAEGPLMHGPTFMANPLAANVALASLDLLEAGDYQAEVARICQGLRAGLMPLARHDAVADVRVFGAIGVVELTEDATTRLHAYLAEASRTSITSRQQNQTNAQGMEQGGKDFQNSMLYQGAMPVMGEPTVSTMANISTMGGFFYEAGVWLRPFGNLIYTMPPFIVKDTEVAHIATTIATLIRKL